VPLRRSFVGASLRRGAPHPPHGNSSLGPVEDSDRRFAAGSPALPPQVHIASAAQSRPCSSELYAAALKVHAPTLARDSATGIGSATDPPTGCGLGIPEVAHSQRLVQWRIRSALSSGRRPCAGYVPLGLTKGRRSRSEGLADRRSRRLSRPDPSRPGAQCANSWRRADARLVSAGRLSRIMLGR
jgi:hypothetical protein